MTSHENKEYNTMLCINLSEYWTSMEARYSTHKSAVRIDDIAKGRTGDRMGILVTIEHE